jgi:hypothetical protein
MRVRHTVSQRPLYYFQPVPLSTSYATLCFRYAFLLEFVVYRLEHYSFAFAWWLSITAWPPAQCCWQFICQHAALLLAVVFATSTYGLCTLFCVARLMKWEY